MDSADLITYGLIILAALFPIFGLVIVIRAIIDNYRNRTFFGFIGWLLLCVIFVALIPLWLIGKIMGAKTASSGRTIEEAIQRGNTISITYSDGLGADITGTLVTFTPQAVYIRNEDGSSSKYSLKDGWSTYY